MREESVASLLQCFPSGHLQSRPSPHHAPPTTHPSSLVLLTNVALRGQLQPATWQGAGPEDLEFLDHLAPHSSLTLPVSLAVRPAIPAHLEVRATHWTIAQGGRGPVLEIDGAEEAGGSTLRFAAVSPDGEEEEQETTGTLTAAVEHLCPSPALLVLSNGARVVLGSAVGFVPGLREGAVVRILRPRPIGLAGSFPAYFAPSPSSITIFAHSPLPSPNLAFRSHLAEASLAHLAPAALFQLALPAPLPSLGPSAFDWLGEAPGEHSAFTAPLLEGDLHRIPWHTERSTVNATATSWHRSGGGDALVMAVACPRSPHPSAPPYLEITHCPALGVDSASPSPSGPAVLFTRLKVQGRALVCVSRFWLLRTSAVGHPPSRAVWAAGDLRLFTGAAWKLIPNPSPCATLQRPLPSLRTLIGAKVVPPRMNPTGIVLHVGGDPSDSSAQVRLLDPTSGDFADCYLPSALLPLLHLGAEIALLGMERNFNKAARVYFKGTQPRLLLLAFAPHTLWAARPSAPYKPLAHRPPEGSRANLAWRTWARVDRISRLELSLSPPRRGRLSVSLSALVDDGSGLTDCWADQGAGLCLLGIRPGSEREDTLRQFVLRFGRVVLREAAFSSEDEQGGRRLLGRKAWEVAELGDMGTPGALSQAARNLLFSALDNAPSTIERQWVLYLHLPGRARGGELVLGDEAPAGDFGVSNKADTRQAAVGRTKVEVASWFAPKVKILQSWPAGDG